jgi:predicted aspartyl protease
VKKTKAPKPSESTANQPPANSDAYDRAIDIATGATTISKSAVSRQDWSLVASQWQQAISLMKTVPTSSKQHINAQSKVTQYQRFLTEAKEKATPPAKKPQQGDTNPQFFSVPIKGRAGGTPIVEVTIDGTQTFEMLFDTGATGTLITLGMAKALRLKPVGVTKSVIADGSVVTLPVVILKSIEIDGRLKRKVPVSVAPPAMPIGLLGQNFYEGYDISIKEDIIEFRRR